jgi:hypothetical protein
MTAALSVTTIEIGSACAVEAKPKTNSMAVEAKVDFLFLERRDICTPKISPKIFRGNGQNLTAIPITPPPVN